MQTANDVRRDCIINVPASVYAQCNSVDVIMHYCTLDHSYLSDSWTFSARSYRHGKLMYALDVLIHVTMVALPPTYKPASYTHDVVYPFGLTWDLVNKYRLRGSSPNYCERQARNLEQPLILDDV